jgi:DNA polymerase III gamma/tau subunit
LWQILLQGIKEIKEANNQKITAEILFLKLLWHTELQSINQIIEISPTKNTTSSPKILTTANKESTQTQKKKQLHLI